MTLAVAVWAVGYALEIAGSDLATKIVCAKIEYLAIVIVPVREPRNSRDTMYFTVPFPLPLSPEVIAIHATESAATCAVHAQPEGAVTAT